MQFRRRRNAMAKGNGKGQPQESHERDEVRSRAMATTSPRRGLMQGGSFPLARLRHEFDRLYDEFFRGWGGLPAWPNERESGWGLDVEDKEDKIIVRAEAPGFEPD